MFFLEPQHELLDDEPRFGCLGRHHSMYSAVLADRMARIKTAIAIPAIVDVLREWEWDWVIVIAVGEGFAALVAVPVGVAVVLVVAAVPLPVLFWLIVIISGFSGAGQVH